MVLAFRGLDPSLAAATINSANNLTTRGKITMRLMLPALLSAVLCIGVVAISVFEIEHDRHAGSDQRLSHQAASATRGFLRVYSMAGPLFCPSLLAPAFINGWLFVAVHSMRDLSAPGMLHMGKSTVLAVGLCGLWKD